jgi:hypothetical protein
VGSLMPVVQKESSLFIGKYEKTDVYWTSDGMWP